MSQKDSGAGFMAGLFIGAAIGAGLALIMAPQSGEETRELLLEKSEELRGRADELSGTARSKADELTGRAREMINQQRETIKGAFEEGRLAATQEARTEA